MLVGPVTDRPLVIASYSGLLGGAERVLLDCATRLPRPLIVACPRGPLAAATVAAGLRHAEIAERSPRLRPAASHGARLVRMAWELGGLVHRHRPVALVAWSARAVLAAALLPRRPALVAVLHDLHDGRVRTAVRTAVRAAAQRADGVVATSHAVAARLAPDAAILHPGVDLAAFVATPLPAGPPRALFLGALVAWKRPELALEVAARVPELQLTIAGAPLPGDDGRLAAVLRERAAALGGRVTFAGHVDARAALGASHCLLHCADAEPYGLALVEALACGRPVVAPAAAGPLEIVADGAGRLYPPGDAAAAAAAVRAVLADPSAPAAARRRAESFDVNASAARLAEAIGAAIARAGR
jgi:glycosyltransferase involved in cell wall biosynthesis